MDQRLVVTMAFAVHLIGGAMLAAAYTVADVGFTDGQLEFLVLVAYLAPTFAMVLIWLRNYVYGAPLLVGSTIAGGWFSLYFFFLHDEPPSVATVTGEGAGAFRSAAIVVVLASILLACVGTWLWYRESEGFRTRVDSVLRPPESSD